MVMLVYFGKYLEKNTCKNTKNSHLRFIYIIIYLCDLGLFLGVSSFFLRLFVVFLKSLFKRLKGFFDVCV